MSMKKTADEEQSVIIYGVNDIHALALALYDEMIPLLVKGYRLTGLEAVKRVNDSFLKHQANLAALQKASIHHS
jgi:hypothetical protein